MKIGLYTVHFSVITGRDLQRPKRTLFGHLRYKCADYRKYAHNERDLKTYSLKKELFYIKEFFLKFLDNRKKSDIIIMCICAFLSKIRVLFVPRLAELKRRNGDQNEE